MSRAQRQVHAEVYGIFEGNKLISLHLNPEDSAIWNLGKTYSITTERWIGEHPGVGDDDLDDLVDLDRAINHAFHDANMTRSWMEPTAPLPPPPPTPIEFMQSMIRPTKFTITIDQEVTE